MNILKNSFLSNVIAFATATILAVGSVSQVQAKGAANAKSIAADEDIRIVKVDDSNFEKEILHSKTPVILGLARISIPMNPHTRRPAELEIVLVCSRLYVFSLDTRKSLTDRGLSGVKAFSSHHS